MSTALVTGPTAGIGRSFARRLAADRYDLILVARDIERLQELAGELRSAYDVDVEVLVADLAEPEGCRRVEERLSDPLRPVDMLVNNAGFGINSRFVGGDLETEDRMLHVLVAAVQRLTHAALPGMVSRGHGAVVNVSSVAAFVPQGTYSAAKAWVNSFSLGLAGDLAGTGVAMLALCPGFTRTEFHQRAGLDMRRIPSWLWLQAEDVVTAAFAAMHRGQVVCVPGRQYKVIVTMARLAPPMVVGALSRRVRGTARRPLEA